MVSEVAMWKRRVVRTSFLAALAVYFVLAMIYDFIFAIFQIIDNMLRRFQWWMIAGRLRDKDGNITRENIDSFKELVDKIEKNDKQKKDEEGNS